jgi:hypothetical protein
MRFVPSKEQEAYLQRLGVPAFCVGRLASSVPPVAPASASTKRKPARSVPAGVGTHYTAPRPKCALGGSPAGLGAWLRRCLAEIF